MIAQVNLYHPQFRKKHLSLSFKRMLILAGISMLSLPALLVYDYQQRQEIAAYSAALVHEYERMEQQWKNIQDRLNVKVIDRQLAIEASKLKTIFDYRVELLQLINDSGFAPHTGHSGYSAYMIALARQHLPSLWLTHVGIVKNGTSMQIEGETRDAESVPAYLARLARESAFAGTKLDILKIDDSNDDQPNSHPLHFVMTTNRNES